MTRRNRLKQLEQENARRESPKRVYLRNLLEYVEKAKRGRQGDAVAEQEARELREKLERMRDAG